MAPSFPCPRLTPSPLFARHAILMCRGIIHLVASLCFSFRDNVLIVCNPLGDRSHAVFTQKSRGGERENEGIRVSDHPTPTVKRSCRPVEDRSQQHCCFQSPADHKTLDQAHTNALYYEAPRDECFLLKCKRGPSLVINRRRTALTERGMLR